MITDLSLTKILILAGADAVNPCALAVLVLVLVSILTVKKSKTAVLKAGFAFTLAVYTFYFLYGLIMIGLFKSLALTIAGIKVYLYNALAIFAMLLGALNIKDAIFYKPGGVMTEMPLSMRPTIKRLIKKITSPSGAFFIGIFVTIFLLPCSIGPYIIASGILSAIGFLSVIPWLLLYNLIFVLPMIAIILIVYLGYSTVEKVGGWKEANIRWLHFIAGLILFLIGLLMLLGII
jgi:cytochrome c biogenesis protein CcdA